MVMTVEFELMGQRFVGINGGQEFKFDEAISLQINCQDQDEVDYYWDALTADGGEESMCGWLKDKYGLSWQVTPAGLDHVFSDANPEQAKRVMEAMLEMRKLDVDALRATAEGAPAA
jgi:predicted 3-demethylubiquinone-9 3-methyltransferase (glyoxalase superfamily)